MYVSHQHFVEESEALARARDIGVGELVTCGQAGLNATRVPFVLDQRGEQLFVETHIARVNPQWRDDGEALLIVSGPDAHVAGHYLPPEDHDARMPLVPTWDYLTVHIRGKLTAHDDAEWKRAHLQKMVDHHETEWSVKDNSSVERVNRALTALVGVEIEVTSVLGKAKLHQNMDSDQIEHIAQNLTDNGAVEVGNLMREIAVPWALDRESRVGHVLSLKAAKRENRRPDGAAESGSF